MRKNQVVVVAHMMIGSKEDLRDAFKTLEDLLFHIPEKPQDEYSAGHCVEAKFEVADFEMGFLTEAQPMLNELHRRCKED